MPTIRVMMQGDRFTYRKKIHVKTCPDCQGRGVAPRILRSGKQFLALCYRCRPARLHGL